MSSIFEAMMVISFGISWPASLIKSYRSRTAKGKSIIFLSFILFGYIFGIISKITASNISYVLVFYIINFVMVFADLCLYFRNKRFDAKE
ncbi:MAG: hypothetical protein K0S76_952 [Herbinix sp.]|jgi:lipopolysaccharide export LptBFGC system permease protein LptF|nr:hypothetical protein [Herbinix sp.]